MCFPISRFKISDRSMLPNFNDGDFVLVSKIYFSLKKGNVVVFKKDGKLLIKRIDKIENEKIFVSADNPAGQNSKHFGPIKRELIVGKVFKHIKK